MAHLPVLSLHTHAKQRSQVCKRLSGKPSRLSCIKVIGQVCRLLLIRLPMKLFAAREDDAHQGWVWLQRSSLPARSVIKIRNPMNGNCVYCEALQIDDNFLKNYNQSPRFTITQPSDTIVIGAWYRAMLGGIQSQAELPLEITTCNSWWGQFKYCTGHPQVVVRLATWLGGIGLLLGLIGLVLGIISIWSPMTQ